MIKTSLSQINQQAKLTFPFNLQSPPFPFNLQAPGMGVEGVSQPGQFRQRSIRFGLAVAACFDPGCGGVVRHGR
jgi:hypothetical protein